MFSVFSHYAASILPWIVVGIVITYFAEKCIFHSRFIANLRGLPAYSRLLFSQFLGMISPLSIMSFIPLAQELTTVGISPSLVFSFLMAERAYDMQSFFIIWGLFGLKFALINALIIFTSLSVTALIVRKDRIVITRSAGRHPAGFWSRQINLL